MILILDHLKLSQKGQYMAKSGVFVVPNGNKWSTKHTGISTPISNHNTKAKALEVGTHIARKEKTELTILRQNGTIQNRNSFGNDPLPPKDRK